MSEVEMALVKSLSDLATVVNNLMNQVFVLAKEVKELKESR